MKLPIDILAGKPGDNNLLPFLFQEEQEPEKEQKAEEAFLHLQFPGLNGGGD